MEIYIVRHCEPDYSKDSLTPKGFQEAKLLAKRLEKVNADYMYCSPLGRAQKTASFTLEATGKTAETLDWLREFQGRVKKGAIMTECCWDRKPSYWTKIPDYYTYEKWHKVPLMRRNKVFRYYKEVCDGVDELLRLGQHNSIYFHNCEWLPCSIMGQKDYVDKYKIKTSHIPLHQPHREADDSDEIPEDSCVVTSTYSMTTDDWKKMNLFSAIVHSCHHMGLLQFFALYLCNEGICSYKEFYSSLLEFALSNSETVIGSVFCKINGYLNDVIEEKGTLYKKDEKVEFNKGDIVLIDKGEVYYWDDIVQ